MSNTATAVLILVIGAVLAYLVPRILPRIGRFLGPRSPSVRTWSTTPSRLSPSMTPRLPTAPAPHFPNVSAELDPGVFERGFPNWEAYGYVFRQDIAAVGPPPSGVCRDWRNWARVRAGVDADATKLQVTVEGRSDSEVRIDRLEIEMLRRAEPLRGSHARCDVGGASASPRQVYVDLDDDPPRVEFVERGDSPGENPRRYFLFSPSRGEVETFLIYATAARGSYDWIGRLWYVAEGQRQFVEITDGGDPFRTTASNRARTYTWLNGAWHRRRR